MSTLTVARLEKQPREAAAAACRERGNTLVLGQSEWLALPGIGIMAIDAKLDTGARTSVLHAENIELVEREGGEIVRFLCHPLIDDLDFVVECEAPLWDMREVRCSNGDTEQRPFILQRVQNGDLFWEIELNLTSRRAMRHRMLLGRGALAGRFLVNPARRHLLGKIDPAEAYPGYTPSTTPPPFPSSDSECP